jgi:sugar lactone lactonase YvrE
MRKGLLLAIGVLLFAAGVGVGVFLERGKVFDWRGGTSDSGDDTAAPAARPITAAFYPEGPCYADGALYYVEYSAHRVMTSDGRTTKEVWHEEGTGPSAILPLKDGQMLIACYEKHELVRLDAEGNRIGEIGPEVDGVKIQWPNDFAMDADRGVFFSASGEWPKDAKAAKDAKPEGKVYYLAPDGKKVSQVAEKIYYSNGLAIIKDEEGGKSLLVAETLRNRVLKYKIGENGSLTGGDVWVELSKILPNPKDADAALGPDGLKADSKGNVYVCQNGAGRILVIGHDRTLRRVVPVPLKYVTNVAFGPQEESLYVTAVRDAWNEPYLGAVYKIPNP